jgi:hypothetical protein
MTSPTAVAYEGVLWPLVAQGRQEGVSYIAHLSVPGSFASILAFRLMSGCGQLRNCRCSKGIADRGTLTAHVAAAAGAHGEES